MRCFFGKFHFYVILFFIKLKSDSIDFNNANVLQFFVVVFIFFNFILYYIIIYLAIKNCKYFICFDIQNNFKNIFKARTYYIYIKQYIGEPARSGSRERMCVQTLPEILF